MQSNLLAVPTKPQSWLPATPRSAPHALFSLSLCLLSVPPTAVQSPPWAFALAVLAPRQAPAPGAPCPGSSRINCLERCCRAAALPRGSAHACLTASLPAPHQPMFAGLSSVPLAAPQTQLHESRAPAGAALCHISGIYGPSTIIR